MGEGGLRGEAGRETWDFGGAPNGGLTGERGSVRELEDLGDRTVDGLVTWRLVATAGLTRFLGAGMSCDGSGVFSLSA